MATKHLPLLFGSVMDSPMLVTCAVVLLSGVFLGLFRLRKQKILHSDPFGVVDIYRLACVGNLPDFLRRRRKSLGLDRFWILLCTPVIVADVLILTHPDDQQSFLKREHQSGIALNFPESLISIHSSENIQLLHGPRHQFVRKIFLAVLSPRALQSFLRPMLERFSRMWKRLQESKGEVVVQNEIRRTQLELMMEILYGIDGEQEEMDGIEKDFATVQGALFSLPNSQKCRDGQEAQKRLNSMYQRIFTSILEQRRSIVDRSAESDKYSRNALEHIADALLDSGKADDPEARNLVMKQVPFLMEAAHETTMLVSTAMLFYLGSSRNAEALAKVRREVASLGPEPSAEQIKEGLPYLVACVNEAQRLCPVVGQIAYTLPKGSSATLRDGLVINGPVQVLSSFSNWYRDPECFPDPTRFSPERWVKTEEEGGATAFARKVFRPFGLGRHVCLGEKLAWQSLKANMICFIRSSSALRYDESAIHSDSKIFPERVVTNGLPAKVVRVGLEQQF